MTLDHVLFILNSAVKPERRFRLLLCYLRLSLKKSLSRWFKFEKENFLGFKVKVLSYRGFYSMFVDIFVKNNYYFNTDATEPVIIDGGANIGMAALYFKYLYPSAKIIAFEPFAETYEVLQKNIDLNKLAGITAVNAALAESAEQEVPFYYLDKSPSSTGHSLNKNLCQTKAEYHHKLVQQRFVRTVLLSDYINEETDAVKLDVEGSELAIIKELKSSGKLGKIKEMVFEYHYNAEFASNDLDEMLNIFKTSGLRSLIYRADHDYNIYQLKNKDYYHYTILVYR